MKQKCFFVIFCGLFFRATETLEFKVSPCMQFIYKEVFQFAVNYGKCHLSIIYTAYQRTFTPLGNLE